MRRRPRKAPTGHEELYESVDGPIKPTVSELRRLVALTAAAVAQIRKTSSLLTEPLSAKRATKADGTTLG